MIGRKINNYEVVSLLGEGGMGSVYVAQHPVLDRRVAVKVLRREFAEDKTLVARFMNEARAASAIRQPNIIEILDVGTMSDGLPYLMMELLEGESLASRLFRDKRLSTGDALALATQAATALAASHSKQIVHRDLKPDNLFLVPDAGAPGGQRLVILDFGIAKLRGDLSSGSVKTHTGSVMGTPPYMSPEQCRGLVDEIDHRTDIYALGIILHEMLSGAPPFVSAGFGDLLIMHITQPPAPLRTLDAAIAPAVEAIVLRALEKRREDRFSSMAELKSALVAAGAEPVPTVPPQQAAATTDAGRRRVPESRAVDGPRTISTLTSSTGERLAVDPQAPPTVPMRRPGRKVAAVSVVVAGVAGAAVLFLTPVLRAPEHSVVPAPPPVAAVPGPAPSPPAKAVPAPALPAPAPPTPAAAEPTASPPVEPARREVHASRRHAESTSKHATASRPARSSKGAGEASAAPPPPTAPASSPPAQAPTPAPNRAPKVNVDKW